MADLDAKALIERLRQADQRSAQRVNGSSIFKEAADALDVLLKERESDHAAPAEDIGLR